MWLFEENEVSVAPEDCIGFVYIITNTQTGKQYIGKKLFTSARIRRVKGRKRRSRVESDWKQYYGSNKQLLHDVTTIGKEYFKREILHFCRSRGQCSYYEAKLQFQYGVLENPDKFYNEWIQCKIHRKHLKL